MIAKIAHYDWPETWPRLFDELLGLLKSGAESNVHGALRVLTEFIREDITDEQFPYIAPTLLPELYAVFCREEVCVLCLDLAKLKSSHISPITNQTYSNTIRAKCLGIFRDFSETLFMMKEERPDVLVNYLAPMLPAWMGSFKTILEKPSAGVEPEEVVLRHEVLRV